MPFVAPCTGVDGSLFSLFLLGTEGVREGEAVSVCVNISTVTLDAEVDVFLAYAGSFFVGTNAKCW